MKVRIIGEDACPIHDVGGLQRTCVTSPSSLFACFRFVFSGGLDEQGGDSEGSEGVPALLFPEPAYFPEASHPTSLLHSVHPQKVRGQYLMARRQCISLRSRFGRR